MPTEHSSDVKVEIGHVLFIDIVGYSKLLITEQSDQLQTLKQVVRGTEQFRLAEAEGKLLRLPTGDGGALVFRTSPEAPVLCALEISKELKNHPELRVRMGIHSGPVNEITDLNEQANIAGAGINIAQRVMDCGQHALSYICLRRFSDARRNLDQVLNITPDDPDTLAQQAAISQAEGDLPRASALLTPLNPSAANTQVLEAQVYQTILERKPATIIPRLTEILAKPDPALGFFNGELRFWLGWAQEVAGDPDTAHKSWQQAHTELEGFLREQPKNYYLIGDLALTNMGLGDKAAAIALTEQATAAVPVEMDAAEGPGQVEILARVAARTGDHERAIVTLEKLLSTPYAGPLTSNVPLTPALLRLDSMFDPLRNNPRFQKLCQQKSK